jgi:hypothetical protein
MPILGIMASQISGKLWAPEGAYDALATVTLSASTASITFAGIPTGYKHLQIRAIGKSTTTNDQDLYWRYNGDTSAAYSIHYLLGNGAGVFSAGSGSNTFVRTNNFLPRSTYTSIYGATVIDILDYASSSKNKTSRHLTGDDNNGAGAMILDSGCWYNTAPITSILLYPGSGNFDTYSSFALYGVK